MRLFWLSLGLLSLLAGIAGAVLPLLPTVPFLLLAAFCFSRSSERLHVWLTTHPRLGPPITDWQRHGAIRRRVKLIATATIAAAFLLSLALGVPGYVLGIQAVVLSLVLVFLWTRPEGPRTPG
ncbi:YbaN family protein [Oceanicella sp. SM1341]|uniref:YbaN family protein n=1 Tax=Oceanicella sp. SM1341 TaxID=1548889 RepID=UPI000E5501B0|nr:YbaN family protein [Oceanicella sp. SM1341]